MSEQASEQQAQLTQEQITAVVITVLNELVPIMDKAGASSEQIVITAALEVFAQLQGATLLTGLTDFGQFNQAAATLFGCDLDTIVNQMKAVVYEDFSNTSKLCAIIQDETFQAIMNIANPMVLEYYAEKKKKQKRVSFFTEANAAILASITAKYNNANSMIQNIQKRNDLNNAQKERLMKKIQKNYGNSPKAASSSALGAGAGNGSATATTTSAAPAPAPLPPISVLHKLARRMRPSENSNEKVPESPLESPSTTASATTAATTTSSSSAKEWGGEENNGEGRHTPPLYENGNGKGKGEGQGGGKRKKRTRRTKHTKRIKKTRKH